MLLDDAELWLERGEHVSLVGPNGSGKTTLIETLAGVRELPAGKLLTGHNVKLGFLSQHADELGAGTARTVQEATQRATGLTPGKARALLGRFLFSGEDADKPLEVLSGGERRRLSLAILVSAGANVLILDEPTNHLDLESREALEAALGEFKGALLLVSHDRALLDAVGSRTVAVEPDDAGAADSGEAGGRAGGTPAGSLRSYVGGWPEYVRVRAERAAKPARPEPKPKAARPEGAAQAPRAEAGRVAATDWSNRSRPPRRRSGTSRASSPIRRRGTGRRRAPALPPATTRRAARSRSCTSGSSRSARAPSRRTRRPGTSRTPPAPAGMRGSSGRRRSRGRT